MARNSIDEAKITAIDAAARSIIQQDKREQDAKTTRLKAARLANEANPPEPAAKRKSGGSRKQSGAE